MTSVEETKHYEMTWEEVEQAVEVLKQKLYGRPNQIIGISKGGLIPAVMLANHFEVPLYTARMRRVQNMWGIWQAEFMDPESKELIIANDWHTTLIVDDIYDTGVTAALLEGLAPRAEFAFLTSKHQHIELAGRYFPKNTWLDFPWERKHVVSGTQMTQKAEPHPSAAESAVVSNENPEVLPTVTLDIQNGKLGSSTKFGG